TAEAATLPEVDPEAIEAAAERPCAGAPADSSTGPSADRRGTGVGTGVGTGEDVADSDREVPKEEAHYDAAEPPVRDFTPVGHRSETTHGQNRPRSGASSARPADAPPADLPR